MVGVESGMVLRYEGSLKEILAGCFFILIVNSFNYVTNEQIGKRISDSYSNIQNS